LPIGRRPGVDHQRGDSAGHGIGGHQPEGGNACRSKDWVFMGNRPRRPKAQGRPRQGRQPCLGGHFRPTARKGRRRSRPAPWGRLGNVRCPWWEKTGPGRQVWRRRPHWLAIPGRHGRSRGHPWPENATGLPGRRYRQGMRRKASTPAGPPRGPRYPDNKKWFDRGRSPKPRHASTA
jgi:hypothetical protein